MTELASFLSEQRTKYQKQADEAKAKLAEAETELRALDAYEAAKKSKPPRREGERQPRKPREKGKRAELLNLITAQYPDGITRSELLVALNAKGSKQQEQSISNALSALRKAGQLALQDGTYRIPAAP
jgi:hypothetical protein